jgi:hypothetical protein
MQIFVHMVTSVLLELEYLNHANLGHTATRLVCIMPVNVKYALLDSSACLLVKLNRQGSVGRDTTVLLVLFIHSVKFVQ